MDDFGWKQVQGDVFRHPAHPILLSAIIGNGVQMLVLFVTLLLMAVGGAFMPGHHGTLYGAAIFLYAITAGKNIYIYATIKK